MLRDRLAKLPGVATVLLAGERRYSMRLWVQSDRLSAHGLWVFLIFSSAAAAAATGLAPNNSLSKLMAFAGISGSDQPPI